jgi:hypothetical protein
MRSSPATSFEPLGAALLIELIKEKLVAQPRHLAFGRLLCVLLFARLEA